MQNFIKIYELLRAGKKSFEALESIKLVDIAVRQQRARRHSQG